MSDPQARAGAAPRGDRIAIGTAPVSWGIWFARHESQLPWEVFLDEAVEAGYSRIELGPLGYLPAEPDRLAPELERRGLTLSGGFLMAPLGDDRWEQLSSQLDRLCGLLEALGAPYVVVSDALYRELLTGEAVGARRFDERGWRRMIDSVRRIADRAGVHGCRALLHPHADTRIEDPHDVERLLEETEGDPLGLCLDIGHHAYRQGDPVGFIRQHHRRIEYLHLKNVDATILDMARRGDWHLARAVGEGVFVEPWLGVVEFPALRDALADVAYDGVAVVEQDMFPAPPDRPLGVARRTREYLEAIGLGLSAPLGAGRGPGI